MCFLGLGLHAQPKRAATASAGVDHLKQRPLRRFWSLHQTNAANGGQAETEVKAGTEAQCRRVRCV